MQASYLVPSLLCYRGAAGCRVSKIENPTKRHVDRQTNLVKTSMIQQSHLKNGKKLPHRSGWGSNNLCSGPNRPRWLALGRGKPSTAWMTKGKPGSPTFERPKWTFSTGISVASRDFLQVRHLFWDKNMFHVGSMGFLLHFQPIEQPKGYDLSLASQRYDPWEARARRAPGDSQRPSIARSIAASTPSEVEYL